MAVLVSVVAGFALVLSFVLTFAARAAGRRMLLMDSAGVAGQKKQRRNVPNIGGVAIFGAVATVMLTGLGLAWFAPDELARAAPGAAVHLPGIREQTPMALGVLGALLVLHVMGLIDDRRPIGALPKFGVMIAAAALIVVFFDVRLLTALDPMVGGAWLSIALSVTWIVAVTNAMNFMDNMDGLAAGVGVVAGSLFLVSAAIGGQWFVAMTLATLVGALGGFLIFNAPTPVRGASIFMGDGGSLVIGFLLAFLTVRTTYVAPGDGWYAVLMPLCVLAVPLYDMASVIVIRLSQGRSPLVGDRQHFSHRLQAAGLSVPRTLAVIGGCTAITGIGGVMLSAAQGWQAALIGVQVLLVLVVIGVYEHGKGWPLENAPTGRSSQERA